MRLIPCYICDKAVEAHSDKAIAGLCNTHNTTENRDKLKKASYGELLRKYNHFKANRDKKPDDKKPNEPEKPKPPKEDKRKIININEYGELEFE